MNADDGTTNEDNESAYPPDVPNFVAFQRTAEQSAAQNSRLMYTLGAAALGKTRRPFNTARKLGDVPINAADVREPYERYDGVDLHMKPGTLLQGWRAYTMVGFGLPAPAPPRAFSCLEGSYRGDWKTRERRAECVYKDAGWKGTAEDLARWHLSNGGKTCPCGIYASKTIEELQAQNYIKPGSHRNSDTFYHVLAHCTLWGFVIEHELGYRAESVRIEALWVVTSPKMSFTLANMCAADLRQKYGLPVQIGWPVGYKPNTQESFIVDDDQFETADLDDEDQWSFDD